MNKAEKRALEAYPIEMDNVSKGFNFSVEEDINEYPRRIFLNGYRMAEEDMKERFIRFVHEHYPINYIGWIQDFQKEMEDEK